MEFLWGLVFSYWRGTPGGQTKLRSGFHYLAPLRRAQPVSEKIFNGQRKLFQVNQSEHIAGFFSDNLA